MTQNARTARRDFAKAEWASESELCPNKNGAAIFQSRAE